METPEAERRRQPRGIRVDVRGLQRARARRMSLFDWLLPLGMFVLVAVLARTIAAAVPGRLPVERSDVR